jgi:hypothetical protein
VVGYLLACGWLGGGRERVWLTLGGDGAQVEWSTLAPCLKETIEKPALLLGLN